MKKGILESARHIVIEGPIGVGKTSLARRLGKHLDAEPILERPEINPFLSSFYRNSSRYALQTQLFFLFQRIDQLRELSQPGLFSRTVINDYLLQKDPLFAELTLNENEYRLYRQIYASLSQQAASIRPDIVIYLHARPETLIARVHKRNMEFEHGITDDYIMRISEKYTQLFHSYNASPVMIVNSENLNFAEDDEDFRLLVQHIDAMRGHREYFNKGG
ncbi:MAG: deoxynucleoside kinase [Candidatus Accumulibacter sp.]|jgi:deoxyadenosine/deoxycytidine kinase|nr:deoxynucleoside kinase [Accumulibacter sp.]